MSKRGKPKYEKPLEKLAPNPCLHCPNPLPELRMDKMIAVGFGDAHLQCDGKIVWSEMQHEQQHPEGGWEDLMTVAQAEELAVKRPKSDWRIVLHGPLHGETYQRQGIGKWVCIEQNEGFA